MRNKKLALQANNTSNTSKQTYNEEFKIFLSKTLPGTATTSLIYILLKNNIFFIFL